ncbi:MAG TPA: M1 family metallopeptidase, partial [Salinimicrobium sp.]|nr:M1 family metallopeptidase [Salinimicrobium sp.]
THLEAQLAIHPLEKKVSGNLTYTFDLLKETDSIFIDARNMEFGNIEFNGEEIAFFNDGKNLWLISDFQKSKNNRLTFNYSAQPKKAMYFVGWRTSKKGIFEENYEPQVWTQGQGKYTSSWLPSFDDTTEKLEFDISIDFQNDFEVISNGKLLETVKINDSVTRWKYDMQHPMSSYLVAIAAGKYEKQEQTASDGTPLIYFYYPKDEEEVEPTYRYTKRMFDFLEKEIGVPYPWMNYKQVPVRNFLYSGMENTTTTIFSDALITDSIAFKDRNYIMVNAHELAHQWFGDMVTAATAEDHWLQEGFATYYAMLAEKEVFGENYFYWNLYQTAERLKKLSDDGKGEAILIPNASSLTYYQKAAWALHILKEKVGKEAFDAAVRNYLSQHKYKTATTSDFIKEVEKESGKDLTDFVDNWLKQSAFQGTEALESLKKSEFITNYLEIAALKELPLSQKREKLKVALDFPVNDYIGQEVVHQLAWEETSEVLPLYKKAFASNNIFVRQAIATTLKSIPAELKQEYESLLSDDSYLTKELALFNLWTNFPEERIKYLDSMKGIEGFSDKNIEMLWLALNLASPEYEPENKKQVFEKLTGYTAQYFPFQIRQNAFSYLFQLNSFTEMNLRHLLQGSQHAVGRFKTFSRDLIKELLKNELYEQRFRELKNLPENQEKYLQTLLSEE